MLESSLPQVTINPVEIVKRRTASWRGVRAEIVQFNGEEPIEYEYQSPLGRYVPRVELRTTYFYLDPTELAVDPELDLSRIDFAPRLFFYDPALWSTAAKLTSTIEAPFGDSRLYAEALSVVLAVELIRLERGIELPQAAARGGLAAWQERAARDYIDAHLADDIALADLAAIAKLSPAHFCRAFKASVGMPPRRYQMQRRIEEAKILLAKPEQSILEIALACGFGFSSSFTKSFHKATGVTPSEFRRALQ